ncbi:MAG: M48 family metallopeptidase [Bdellovibrionales bacterium]|nr:M48 family metallopeptidase [Bdellovibrionales bacterium]
MSESQLLSRIRKDARRIAKRFNLRYLEIAPEGPRAKRFGSCDSTKTIRIRLQNLRDGAFLSYPHLVHTLCHEMAHLKHMNHGRHFKDLNTEILSWARERGIYCR